jgi:hypothetical protein
MQGKELIKKICTTGTPKEKRALFEFTADTPLEKVVVKFGLFARTCYPRYFQHKSAPFHKVMVANYLRSYLLDENRMELGFRGCAKTSLLELTTTFILLNDTTTRKKYIKILARDLKNSRQLVTDIYNKVIEVEDIYGDLFEDEGKKKREETMSSFTMKKGVKLSAGTVGQSQRGHKQDAYRPDWVLFEDIEDRESISSQVITAGVIQRCDEAITGLAIDSSFVVNGNYISEDGTIEWFKKKSNVTTNITPIMEPNGEPTWPVITKERIEQLRKDSLDFAGEYLCDPQRSGAKYFDQDRIRHDLTMIKAPERNSGAVRYWSSYLPSNAYGIGADTSEGKGLDSCAMALFDYTTGTLVGTFNDNTIMPDLFAFELVRVGREFGNCVLAPEVNNTSGGMVIQVLKQKEYPNIHRKTLTDRMNNVLTKQLGWHTNSKTKPQMLAELRRDYNNGLIHIYDEQVLKEMRAFNINDVADDTPGLATRHFDLLMAVAIAWQMRNFAYPEEMEDDDEVWGDYSMAQV